MSRYATKEPLQVFPFWKVKRDGVVGRGTQALNDLGFHASVERGASHNLLEEIGGNTAGARKGNQKAAGTQQLESKEVDILVRTRGLCSMCRRRCELRRIEHY